MSFIALSQLEPCEMTWLWPGHLPIGQLVLLDGDPGVGKSLLTLDLCARITTGQQFPDGAAAVEPANVLILNAEDHARQLIRPRLVAARANIERVTVWHRNPGEPWLGLPGDLKELDAALARLRPRLVVLDPVTAFLDSGLNLNSEHEVRHVLSPLADLAAKHDCAVQMIRHLNKGGGQRALYRGLHSIGFVAACRLAWLVGRDPRLPSRLVLAEEKTNLNVPQPSLAYTIASHSSGHAVLEWQGPVAWTADDLLGGGTRRDRLRQRACEVLAAILKDGPLPARDATRAARQHGVSPRTLRRARRELNIESRIVGTYRQHQNWWLLPGQELPDSVDSPEMKELRRVLWKLDDSGAGGEKRVG